MTIYWLLINGEPLTSVTGPPGLSDADVRQRALDALERNPGLCAPEAPYARRSLIERSTVRIYP